MDVQIILAKLKQYPIAVVSGILAIAFLAGMYFRGGAVPEMQAELDELTSQVNIIRRNTDNAVGLEADLERMRELVASVEDRLMVREQRAINVQYFYAFENEEDIINIISVNQVAPNPAGPRGQAGGSPLDNYDVIQFSAQAEGTFDEVLRLFHRLRNGEKIIRIRDFGLSPKGGGVTTEDLIVNFTLDVLGKKPEEANNR